MHLLCSCVHSLCSSSRAESVLVLKFISVRHMGIDFLVQNRADVPSFLPREFLFCFVCIGYVSPI